MVDLLVLSAVLPLLGAGAILALSFLLSQLSIDRHYIKGLFIALAIGMVVLASVVAFGSGDGERIILSSPYPSPLAEVELELRWDAVLWPLGLGLSVVTGALLLAAVGRDEPASHRVAVLLVLVGAGLAALWSANPFTTIVCWAFYDLAFAVGRIVAGHRRQDAVRSLAIGTAAGLLVWIGMLIAEGGMGGVQWALMPPGGAKMTYWMLAGFLRFGVYPLHVSSARRVDSDSSLAGALFLSPVLGWGLWIRLALVSDRAVPVSTWMAIPALSTLAAGGFLAWTARRSQDSLPWISLGANGGLILAAVLASLWGAGQGMAEGAVVSMMTLGAVGWMLGTTVLFLGAGFDLQQPFRWESLLRGVALLVGAFSLISAPVTMGFVGESALASELIRANRWGWSVAYFIGRVFLAAAVVRWLIASRSGPWEDAGLLRRVAEGLGVTSLTIPLVAVGILPNNILAGGSYSQAVTPLRSVLVAPGLMGWLLWGGPLLLGGLLAWLDARLRPRISLWLSALHDIVVLDWGYELLMGAFEQGFGLLRVADEVLSGRGALLWSCIVLLVVVLIVER